MNHFFKYSFSCLLLIHFCCFAQVKSDFASALNNGVLANEGLLRCNNYMTGWLSYADSSTGLLPSRLKEWSYDWNWWDPENSAADNYPFMVMTAYLTDSSVFNNRMMDILNTETGFKSDYGCLPATYDFETQTLRKESLAEVIFGASEYVKDGLLPLTEWLGSSPWCDRMISIIDDIWAYADVETEFGIVPSVSHEIAGELLQSLSRIYWMTGEQKYLDWAIRLGDYFLLGDHHPTENSTILGLRDHGNEIIAGLTELYATIIYTDPIKKESYKIPVYKMLDKILEIGRNKDGLLYNEIYPQTGEHSTNFADTWGYVLNAHYTVYLIDSIQNYRAAVIKALENIGSPYYIEYNRFGQEMDGYADAIESALNLYNREYSEPSTIYMDKSIRKMWDIQKSNGIIEGWYGDGNFARTTIMYCLWKSQGLFLSNWKKDIYCGAVTAYNYDSPAPSDMVAYSNYNYNMVKNGSDIGASLFTDRVYTIRELPGYLVAETIIQTACEDINTDANKIISFTTSSDLLIYLAIDKRLSGLPEWLDGWMLTDDNILTNDNEVEFRLYQKDFTSGTEVILGGLKSETSLNDPICNYVVFLKYQNQQVSQQNKQKNILKASLKSGSNWNGKLFFDTQRHKTNMHMPFNWARINQFPEWYTVEKDSLYMVYNLTLQTNNTFTGSEMAEGIPVTLSKDIVQNLLVAPAYLELDTSLLTSLEDPEIVHIRPPVSTYYIDDYQGCTLPDCLTNSSISVYDLRGCLIWQGNTGIFNNKKWSFLKKNEIYIFRIIRGQEVYTKKIVII